MGHSASQKEKEKFIFLSHVTYVYHAYEEKQPEKNEFSFWFQMNGWNSMGGPPHRMILFSSGNNRREKEGRVPPSLSLMIRTVAHHFGLSQIITRVNDAN